MGLFQKPPTGSFFLFYILGLIYFLRYKTIVRSSASYFGHSDPDPSSVKAYQSVSNFMYHHLSNFTLFYLYMWFE